jgi:hypothetical protein
MRRFAATVEFHLQMIVLLCFTFWNTRSMSYRDGERVAKIYISCIVAVIVLSSRKHLSFIRYPTQWYTVNGLLS